MFQSVGNLKEQLSKLNPLDSDEDEMNEKQIQRFSTVVKKLEHKIVTGEEIEEEKDKKSDPSSNEKTKLFSSVGDIKDQMTNLPSIMDFVDEDEDDEVSVKRYSTVVQKMERKMRGEEVPEDPIESSIPQKEESKFKLFTSVAKLKDQMKNVDKMVDMTKDSQEKGFMHENFEMKIEDPKDKEYNFDDEEESYGNDGNDEFGEFNVNVNLSSIAQKYIEKEEEEPNKNESFEGKISSPLPQIPVKKQNEDEPPKPKIRIVHNSMILEEEQLLEGDDYFEQNEEEEEEKYDYDYDYNTNEQKEPTNNLNIQHKKSPPPPIPKRKKEEEQKNEILKKKKSPPPPIPPQRRGAKQQQQKLNPPPPVPARRPLSQDFTETAQKKETRPPIRPSLRTSINFSREEANRRKREREIQRKRELEQRLLNEKTEFRIKKKEENVNVENIQNITQLQELLKKNETSSIIKKTPPPVPTRRKRN